MFKHTSIEDLYALFLGAGQKICTDTRKITEGAIFFALKGPNFNANQLAAQALAAGCSYAVIDEEAFVSNHKTILVADVLTALQQLAAFHRQQFKFPVLAITGSNAKTTHKELINAVLSKKYAVLFTRGNLNNHIGVPLTLLSITKQHNFAIIEMGANHVGEIATLCDIAQPDYGLITNIGKAHLEGFGGIEGVKKGKSELYKFLNSGNGTAFINGDDPTLVELARNIKTITYGEKEHNSFRAVNTSGEGKVSFSYRSNKGEGEHVVKTQMVGTYNFINCVAAACVGSYFGVPDQDIVAALQNYLPDMNRSQLVTTEKNELILDAYNANPNSMKAAIENFVSYPAKKKMLLLGDMFELGDYSAAEHTAIVDLLKDKKMDEALLIGKEFTKAAGAEFRTFGTTKECSDYLQRMAPTGYTILIKGSRGMKMEVLQDVL